MRLQPASRGVLSWPSAILVCKRLYNLDALLARALSAHVELAENGVFHCLPWEAPRSTVDTRNKKEMIAL